jgi:AraC-like DNA-binding protein
MQGGFALVPTYDVKTFLAAPMGRCLITASFALWCYAPDLQGGIMWGTLDERTSRDWFAAGRYLAHRSIATPRRALIDFSGLERVHSDAIVGFIAAAPKHISTFWRGLERQAMILPASLDGVMVAGALTMSGLQHALRVVRDPAEAIRFVDHPDAAAAHTTASQLVAAYRGRPSVLARLRAHLATNLNAPTIESSAAALHMSTRTLQRELKRLRTSFSEQLRLVRIATAERLLVHSDHKIQSIAREVGLGTASRMSAALRRDRKMTASELRAALRQRSQRTAPPLGEEISSSRRWQRRVPS